MTLCNLIVLKSFTLSVLFLPGLQACILQITLIYKLHLRSGTFWGFYLAIYYGPGQRD